MCNDTLSCNISSAAPTQALSDGSGEAHNEEAEGEITVAAATGPVAGASMLHLARQ